MTADSGLVKDKKNYQLSDQLGENQGQALKRSDLNKNQPVVVIDGRGYDNVQMHSQSIHELTEIVDDEPAMGDINDLALKRAIERIEKIAREAILDIAERVIREEMEKIKKLNKKNLNHQD